MSGNVAVLPLECLLSAAEATASSAGFPSRLLLAEAVIHLWLEDLYPTHRLTTEADLFSCLYTATLIRKLLLDLFIQVGYGHNNARTLNPKPYTLHFCSSYAHYQAV